MHRDPDPITEVDLAAYVDEQLSSARRIEVEAHLAARPAEAARVMAELRTRDELRLALRAQPLPVSVPTNAIAGRLERSLRNRAVMRRAARAAALVALLGAGWVAHAEFNALSVRQSVASAPPPAFVADALRAHSTSALRAEMVSQPESAVFDPAEILSATAIRVPDLPTGWAVRDVQVFPSTFGSSLEMAVSSPEFGPLSLFAVRPGSFDVVPSSAVTQGEETAAYWQVGEVAYALISTGAGRQALEREARRIEASLH
ncbi:anti-sigma factor family protein [Antarcticirhabdus aurantiaca]|uniref:Anti-sigma factor n=1 Tax=Antarcticirhabdus aurantiaca TaxID=2606717 RepID=A0ACD4NS52_9HYPH|nr:anti-sigma factor [Antarcticirhabdus aurantiaca]WAJ29759.1 anti-sigma factor [Jeongeuplla avenae]